MKPIKKLREEAGTLDSIFEGYFEEIFHKGTDDITRKELFVQVELLLDKMKSESYSTECISVYEDVYKQAKFHYA